MIVLALMLGSPALAVVGCASSNSVGLPPPPPGLGGGNGSLSITVRRAYAYNGSPWRWLAWALQAPARAASSGKRFLRVTVLPPDYPTIADKTVEVPDAGPVSLEFQARVPVGTGHTVAATEFGSGSDQFYGRPALAFGKVRNITVYPDRVAGSAPCTIRPRRLGQRSDTKPSTTDPPR